MKTIRKPISILIALIMILSVFTIIPVTTAGAAAAAATRAGIRNSPPTAYFVADTDGKGDILICQKVKNF